jgi:Na+-transporting NADH:ubiquinone oxidoreductase subunit C
VTATSLVAALVLSLASQSLKGLQEKNVELDRKQNILAAAGLLEEEGCDDLAACYERYIESYVIDSEGKTIDNPEKPALDIQFEKQLDVKPEERNLPVFVTKKDGKVVSYIIPVVGKGVWSTLYGYLALENDLNTIRGITFYKHAETPGLGAEIEKEWFQDNFKGKKIFDEKGNLVSVTVIKGKVDPDMKNSEHRVDGISGATLTGDGVSDLLKEVLEIYEPFIRMKREDSNG